MSNHIPKPPTAEELALLARLTYDTIAGKVYGIRGKEIGSIRKGMDRVFVTVTTAKGPKHFKRYHVIWWAATGEWPPLEIDHKDRNSLNDAFDNLEPKTHAGNMRNLNPRNKGHDLPRGVVHCVWKETNPYKAQICIDGRTHHIGYYASPELASEAYERKRIECFGA